LSQNSAKEEKKMILITGGFGFLGSYIAAYLAAQKQRVVILDYWQTDAPPILREAIAAGTVQGVSCDLTKIEELIRIVAEYKIKSIIHAAHKATFSKPEEFHSVCYNNLVCDMNIGEVCRQANLPVTFISSSTVYSGLPAQGLMTEDLAVPSLSSNSTGSFKRAGENILGMYLYEFGCDLRIIRPTRIYGPYYRSYLNPVQRMVEATAAGESVSLPKVAGNGGGDFIYVEDLAKAIGMVHLPDKTNHRIYNAGGGLFYTYRQIADIIERMRPGIRITLNDQDTAGAPRKWLDTSRISQEFGFRPSYSLEEGHRAWFDWYVKGE
jgi:nucleoside-diphosphate-sugar epimerase